MNIQAQLCGIILIIIMILFYVRYKSLRLNTQIIFQFLLVVVLFCVFFDMLSIWAIVNLMLKSRTVVVIICKTYLASLVLVGLAGLLYECSGVYERQKKFIWVTMVGTGIAIVYIIVIACLPINISKHGRIVYTEGPSVLMTYLGTCSFLVANFILTIRKRRQANPRRTQVVLMWLGIWFAAAVVQFLNNELLLVGYAGAVGILIIFLRQENPEYMADHVTGLYNQDALLLYARKLYNMDREFSVLSIWFNLGISRADDGEREQAVMVEFARRLPRLPGTRVFKMAEDEVWMVFDELSQVDNTIEQIKVFIESGRKEIGAMAQVEYTYMPSSLLADDYQEMVHLLQYARWKNQDHTVSNFRQVDKEFVVQMKQEKAMELMLEQAMAEERIEVFYQPIYSTREHRFVSAEALVRMRDTEGKLVPPAAFISVAERNGKILQLGEIVFDKVCRFFTEQHLEQYGLHYIEVNLSVVQCSYKQLADDYISIMEKYRINPGYINLEITESASMSAKKTLLGNMQRLMEYGVHFSLDDFGTGQSNLNYIVDMPVDIVKFDREMSQAFFRDEKAQYVMNAAMQMIHGMQLKIVSEGIEEEEQYRKMAQLGIDYIQGYYFSKPLPETEFVDFMKDKV
ncbi:EAL domain-containing protein [bacterium 0.1xD8-71]|nr:EAL domain-containing protein [bacterium 0.1xD8-71]